jgi:hypothetical protein
MWASKHKYMEAMLRISPCSYPCLKLAKMIVFLIMSYIFSLTKSEKKMVEQILPESRGVRV